MKVAYLLGSLNRGGTETLLLDVFKNASQADFNFIGVHRKDGELKKDFYKTNQPVFPLQPAFPFDLRYLFRLRKLLKDQQVDIVHTHQYLDTIYAKIACSGTKIKTVQTIHGFDDIFSGKKNTLLNIALKLADRNIYVSNTQKKYFLKKYPLKSFSQEVVYNGISFDKIDSFQSENITDLGNLPEKRLLLGSVGNFVRGRNQLFICRFLKLLKDTGISFNFLFVGSRNNTIPSLYDECVDYCRKHNLSEDVYFLGGREDVPAILNRLDAFIYSSDHDTFGIAVIEAIAAGIPVFVNDWDVMCEISEEGKFLNLYKTNDEKDLLQRFKLFLDHPVEYKEKAIKNAWQIRQKFNIENHIQELNKLYIRINETN
jgi:glycosyltransferase involved in cell wall biosynthesis